MGNKALTGKSHTTPYTIFYNNAKVRTEEEILIPLMIKGQKFTQTYLDINTTLYKDETYLLNFYIKNKRLRFRLYIVRDDKVINVLNLIAIDDVKAKSLTLKAKSKDDNICITDIILRIYEKSDKSLSTSLTVNSGVIFSVDIGLST